MFDVTELNAINTITDRVAACSATHGAPTSNRL